MSRVKGLVAIVTGAASGMGFADAELFAAEGATIVLTDINETKGRSAAEKIGRNARFIKLDVSSETDWQSVISETARRFGRLDILVNNAGIQVYGDPESTTLAQFRRSNSVISEGAFLGCKHAIPLMARSGGGSIVNIASIAARVGFSGYYSYSVAKCALIGITRCVAMHCQEKGYKIRCNAVLPGAVETPMLEEAEGRIGSPRAIPDGTLPAGAVAAPRDVAELVLYLASATSRFITGAEFVIDNGSIVKPSLWGDLGPAGS